MHAINRMWQHVLKFEKNHNIFQDKNFAQNLNHFFCFEDLISLATKKC